VYIWKKSVEQGYLTEAKESIKTVRQKVDVKAEMVRIKVVVRALPQSFPKLAIQPEGTIEDVVRQVTKLVQSLELKVGEIEARLVRTTPPEVYDQRKVEV